MEQRSLRSRRLFKTLAAASALAAAGSLTWINVGAHAAPAPNDFHGGTVLQTNLVSDLPGVAATMDSNLQNPWGISESGGSPFWISDNNNGLSTLYSTATPPISTVGLVVNIPTPVATTGGAPDGTVFNTAAGAFPVTGLNKAGQTASASPAFLFDTEDGTILGWNPGIDPTGKFAAGGTSAQAVLAVDNSGNNFTNPDPNQQTGAVYKGLALGTSTTPIIAADPNSTALLYAANFRAGTIDVYDAMWNKPTGMAPGAFTDPALPRGFAPFNVQVLGSKLYVTYALQDASKHDDLAGLGRGFVDVFNLDGTPGLPNGQVRLISRGALDSPWGLAIAPAGFAGMTAPNSDPVLLVGNFGNGRIHAYDANTGMFLGHLSDPDGDPIVINNLWALRVGNGGSGGAANTVYFSAGIFNQLHGILGSLTTATPGSPEGPAEGQWVQANLDLVQIDLKQLQADIAAGASQATIQADRMTLDTDTAGFAQAEQAFGADEARDAG